MLDIVEIPAERVRDYAILETKRGEIINVWITSIMYKELRKCDMSQDCVVLVSLGTKLNNTTGIHFNFAVAVTTGPSSGGDEQEWNI